MVWDGFLDILYPLRCLGCGSPTTKDEGPLCARCCRALERVSPEEIVERLATVPGAADSLYGGFSLWTFDKGGSLQKVQHALKYGNRPAYGYNLGEMMGRAFLETATDRPDLVIPIPLHRSRLYERGFNQSTMLGSGFADVLDIPFDDRTLIRGRVTRSQTKLSRAERWKNVAGAFEIRHPEVIDDRAVILIDDVLTTGSTAAAAAQTLRQAGARRVTLATLAMARG